MKEENSLYERIGQELQRLETAGNSRHLRTVRPDGIYLWHQGKRYLNLSSNDYLGLSATPYAHIDLPTYHRDLYGENSQSSFLHGNPASRLMTGNSVEYRILEEELETLFPSKKALVLTCGYMVNSGLMPALAGKGDLILADKLVHASIIEGMQHTGAEFKRFRHNDIGRLAHLLQQAKARTVWVIVESAYSMDGDLAPLQEIAALKETYGFCLYVDEAHSFATRGPQGAGYGAQLGILDQIDLLVCTFGKALAGAGACVLCHPTVHRYLVNKMRPLIYSTALPPTTLMWDAMAIHEMHSPTLTAQGLPSMASLRQKLSHAIATFNAQAGTASETPIIPIMAGSNERALQLVQQGAEAGYWLTAIRHPTVPVGQERIRLSLHAGLTDEQLTSIAALCNISG